MNDLKVYELSAQFDRRKSFYGKAHIIEFDKNGSITWQLQSYETIVAEIVGGGYPKVYGLYSDTTKRHIVEFLRQRGYAVYGKKDVENFLCER